MRSHWIVSALLSILVCSGCSDPSRIVEEAVAASGRGDRAAYVACFTPRSRPLLRTLFTIADAKRPELGRLGEKGAQVASTKAIAPGDKGQARALVTVHEAGRSLPVVVHAEAGAWRIDLMDSERVLTGLGGPF